MTGEGVAGSPPRAHWITLGLLLAVLAVALVFEGYRNDALGASSTAPAGRGRAAVGSGLTDSRPVLNLGGRQMRSTGAGSREIALTFDDGPSPTFTPQVLRVLGRAHVPATFFVVGSRALAYPDLVRAELAAGHEVGSHTFVHVDPAGLPGWRLDLELSLTQDALAGAAGVHTKLFRPPYSSVPTAATENQLAAWRAVARKGYTVVLASRDSDDWRRPGVSHILANATPPAGVGGVVLFHDGGGDRSQTVAALESLIPTLRAQGYRFVTVSDLLGITRGAVDPAPSTGATWQGRALIWAGRAGQDLLGALRFMALTLLGLTVIRALMLAGGAARHARRIRRKGAFDGPTPPVSVLVPAYNEAIAIAATITRLASSDYPELEIIVVDDGSTDDTAGVVEALNLPNVTLIRQANRGKAESLNRALQHAHHEIVVTVDGDTLFESGTIRALVGSFASGDVGAVSGNTKVGNRRGLLGRWQHIEYVMGFNLDRRLFELLQCMPTVPGAIGAFRRQALADAGAFSDDTLAEDTDLTIAINRAGWRVVYEEEAVAWTEAPSSLSSLWRQRYRWSYGTMQAMWKHRGALSRREHSPVGRRAFPYMLGFYVVFPLFAPVVDLFALYALVFARVPIVVGYWAAFNVVQLALAVLAFRLDGESVRPLWVMPLQQFVYRQLMYLVVIQSVVTAFAGARLPWHKLPRTGEAARSLGVPTATD